MLPILQAVLLALYLWNRRQTVAVEVKTQLKDGEPDAYIMDDLQGLVKKSDGHKVDLSGGESIDPSGGHKIDLSDAHSIDLHDGHSVSQGNKLYF